MHRELLRNITNTTVRTYDFTNFGDSATQYDRYDNTRAVSLSDLPLVEGKTLLHRAVDLPRERGSDRGEGRTNTIAGLVSRGAHLTKGSDGKYGVQKDGSGHYFWEYLNQDERVSVIHKAMVLAPHFDPTTEFAINKVMWDGLDPEHKKQVHNVATVLCNRSMELVSGGFGGMPRLKSISEEPEPRTQETKQRMNQLKKWMDAIEDPKKKDGVLHGKVRIFSQGATFKSCV